MTQQELHEALERLAEGLAPDDRNGLRARTQSLVSVYPFNEFEYVLMYLLDRSALTFAEYEDLRSAYVRANRYMHLFGLAPRIFGQIWGEQHLRDLSDRFRKPDAATDPDYEGQYDLWIEGVRVEVKASRAIDTKKRGDIVSKALHTDSDRPFRMNFQQLKPETCDVFVFIGVWLDALRYWVLSTEEVRRSPYLLHQHRGGIEYQIEIRNRNINAFMEYLVAPEDLADRVVSRVRGGY